MKIDPQYVEEVPVYETQTQEIPEILHELGRDADGDPEIVGIQRTIRRNVKVQVGTEKRMKPVFDINQRTGEIVAREIEPIPTEEPLSR